MSWFRNFDHRRIYPCAKFVEYILRTIGYVRFIVRFVYLTQVVRIEADHWLALTAQEGKMLEGI
jgi:hypothetical protein